MIVPAGKVEGPRRHSQFLHKQRSLWILRDSPDEVLEPDEAAQFARGGVDKLGDNGVEDSTCCEELTENALAPPQWNVAEVGENFANEFVGEGEDGREGGGGHGQHNDQLGECVITQIRCLVCELL